MFSGPRLFASTVEALARRLKLRLRYNATSTKISESRMRRLLISLAIVSLAVSALFNSTGATENRLLARLFLQVERPTSKACWLLPMAVGLDVNSPPLATAVGEYVWMTRVAFTMQS